MPIIQYVLVYLVTGRLMGGLDSELSSLITLVDGLHSENATQEAKQSNISMNSMPRQLWHPGYATVHSVIINPTFLSSETELDDKLKQLLKIIMAL